MIIRKTMPIMLVSYLALIGCIVEPEATDEITSEQLAAISHATQGVLFLESSFENGQFGFQQLNEATDSTTTEGVSSNTLFDRTKKTLNSNNIISHTIDCADSGSLDIRWQISSDLGLQAGDFIAISFNQCRNQNEITDGGFQYTLQDFNLQESGLNISGRLTFEQLTTSTDNDSSSLDGEFNFAGTSTTQSTGITDSVFEVFGERVDAVKNEEYWQISEFSFEDIGSDDASLRTRLYDYQVTGPRTDGQVRVKSLTEITRDTSKRFPEAGTIEMSHSEWTAVIEIIDQAEVSINLDTDLDGQWDIEGARIQWISLVE